ncbi:MAG: hypothetical protein HS101_19970 [Planctomycetia bacterium]|nr:hypothetical protein [Planctomycetia bacterium]
MKKTKLLTTAALIGCTVLSTSPAMAININTNALPLAMCRTLQGQSCNENINTPMSIICQGEVAIKGYDQFVALRTTTCTCGTSPPYNTGLIDFIWNGLQLNDSVWECQHHSSQILTGPHPANAMDQPTG